MKWKVVFVVWIGSFLSGFAEIRINQIMASNVRDLVANGLSIFVIGNHDGRCWCEESAPKEKAGLYAGHARSKFVSSSRLQDDLKAVEALRAIHCEICLTRLLGVIDDRGGGGESSPVLKIS